MFWPGESKSWLPAIRGRVTGGHFLGNIVRMQEEIGTGGGGFRFMYAAFLQEAGDVLGLAWAFAKPLIE